MIFTSRFIVPVCVSKKLPVFIPMSEFQRDLFEIMVILAEISPISLNNLQQIFRMQRGRRDIACLRDKSDRENQ